MSFSEFSLFSGNSMYKIVITFALAVIICISVVEVTWEVESLSFIDQFIYFLLVNNSKIKFKLLMSFFRTVLLEFTLYSSIDWKKRVVFLVFRTF